MIRFRLLPMLAVCAVIVLASVAFAQPIGGQIGNLNPPVSAVPDILFGDQGFAYLVFPGDLGFSDPGFMLEAVHMLVDFEQSQIPQLVTVSGGLAHAVWDPTLDLWVPGEVMCSAPPVDYQIIDPGIFELVAPVGAACGCRPINEPYFLIFNFHGPAEGSLAVDDQPLPGFVYLNDGLAWIDMFGLKRTATGKSIIWGDIITCSAPIGVPSSTWGSIKDLYR